MPSCTHPHTHMFNSVALWDECQHVCDARNNSLVKRSLHISLLSQTCCKVSERKFTLNYQKYYGHRRNRIGQWHTNDNGKTQQKFPGCQSPLVGPQTMYSVHVYSIFRTNFPPLSSTTQQVKL